MMKGLILCLALLCCTFSLKAQSYSEIVYLKNGSMIKGIVIEQIPNKTLKIQTKDGSIYVYQMDEVSKITKDLSKLSNNNRSFGQKTGYRGFVDLGYSIGVGDYDVDRLEFSTSHGYQFNPFFYLGAGAALNYYYDSEIASVPLFVNPRLTLPTGGPVSPFLDLKIGYTVSEYVEGFYFSPSIGARFDLKNSNAINFSLGYTMQNVEADYYNYYGQYSYSDNVNMGAITLKLGFEF